MLRNNYFDTSIREVFEYISVGVLSILGLVAVIYLTKHGWETLFFTIPIYILLEWLLLVVVDP